MSKIEQEIYEVGQKFTDLGEVSPGHEIHIEIQYRWIDPEDGEAYYIVRCTWHFADYVGVRMLTGDIEMLHWFQIYKYYREI